MFELQKIFLLVRFFNQISGNKGLKAKISRFLCVFPVEEIQKSASTELREWTENVVNVENCQFLKENCEFLSVI